MNRIIILIAILIAIQYPASASSTFIVKDIQVEGLQRISAGTVFNYLPIKVGDQFTRSKASGAIRALYKTGFFKDIQLRSNADVLVVVVTERPSISSIKIKGTKDISEKDLKKGLKEIGFAEGRVFNKSILERVENDLGKQYFSRGYYSVKIVPTVTPLELNRVAIEIEVIRGEVAKIKDVNIIGNKVFSEAKLLDQFSLSKTGLFSFFSKNDQYSKQKLVADLETLNNYYQNKGFLEFNVNSTSVTISPNMKYIYLTISIFEGKKYQVSGYKFAGKQIISDKKLNKLVTIKAGDDFSRKIVTDISNGITDKLGDKGYAFANVNAIPDIDKNKNEVFFTFYIDPGQRVYVRKINILGNTSTHDKVIRRELRQHESAWLSTEKLKISRLRLQRLGFFEDVNIETPQVSGTPDQVDVNVSVKERPTGNLIFGVGFSDVNGFLINSSVSEKNLFGSGNSVSASINNSRSSTLLDLRYTNPYYTKTGISRGFSLFSRTVDASRARAAAYTNGTQGLGVFFGIPTSEVQTLSFGLTYENNNISANENGPYIANNFIDVYGAKNTVYLATLAWTKNSLNNAILPTAGSRQNISMETAIPGSDLNYYRIIYDNSQYLPITKNSSIRFKASLGYGNGYGDNDLNQPASLPFYKNFFAGGSSTVRGYRPRSIGPRDIITGDPIGASKRVLANVEYLFPIPGMDEGQRSMRLSLFTDGGMVYRKYEEVDLSEMRLSYGIAFNWFSPMGPLSLSYGFPINDRPEDNPERLQFTVGVPLR